MTIDMPLDFQFGRQWEMFAIKCSFEFSVAFSGFWRLKCSGSFPYSFHTHKSSISATKSHPEKDHPEHWFHHHLYRHVNRCAMWNFLPSNVSYKWKVNSKLCHELDFNSEYIWIWSLWGLSLRLRNNIFNSWIFQMYQIYFLEYCQRAASAFSVVLAAICLPLVSEFVFAYYQSAFKFEDRE